MVTVVQIARVVHAANRAWQLEHGDAHPSRPWEESHVDTHEIVIAGVRGMLEGDTPESSHARWVAKKLEQGWTWGPAKDRRRRTHPCMVPFEDLMDHEQAKDRIMHGIVTALAPLLDPAELLPRQGRHGRVTSMPTRAKTPPPSI